MNIEKKTAWLKAWGGIAALVAVVVIVIAANVIIGNLRLRADLTEENLYTLSEGSINILKDLDDHVTLRLFFSSSSPATPTSMKSYARQVEDLLREYQSYAEDKITIVKHDPRPDSEEQEWAERYGLAAQTVDPFGPPIYFGLVASAAENEAVLRGFDPAQQELLEYNLTRLIYRVTHPEKPVLGVISSLPVLGTQIPPGMMPPGQQPPDQEPWVAFQNLEKDYDLRRLEAPVDTIADDVQALVVVHPKDLDDQTLYAIDQFVLGGGQLVLMVDPLSIADPGQPQGNMGMMGGAQRSSNAETLFDAWGVKYDPGQIVADIEAASNLRTPQGGVERNLAALTITTNNINQTDIMTTQLDIMTVPYAGAFKDETAESLTFTPLLYSSDHAGLVGAMTAQFGGSAIQREFKDAPVRMNFAVRLQGEFTTAFPDGPPEDEETGENGDEDEPDASETQTAAAGLTNGTSMVILAADTDLIFDPVAVEQINLFGHTAHRARNDNLNFFANAVEMAAGSRELVSIRSRGRFARPFDRVAALQAKAMREWRGREAELEEKLRETEQKLRQMQTARNDDQRFILSPEQQEAIANFRAEEVRIRDELKDVRRKLRSDIETLGVWVKVLNIALMPLLVSLVGLTYGIYRKRIGG